MLQEIAGSVARTAGSAVSGWIVAHGIAAQGDATTFATVLSGVAVYGAMQAWSIWHKVK